MNSSMRERHTPNAENVTITEDTLAVDLSDGRTISVPLAWFPRLLHASPEERDNWRLIGKGQGIHWEDLDEDISVEGLLAGKPSGESQVSFKKWLQVRSGYKPVRLAEHRHRADAPASAPMSLSLSDAAHAQRVRRSMWHASGGRNTRPLADGTASAHSCPPSRRCPHR
jgi:Protein of unknown function (DUF2442)